MLANLGRVFTGLFSHVRSPECAYPGILYVCMYIPYKWPLLPVCPDHPTAPWPDASECASRQATHQLSVLRLVVGLVDGLHLAWALGLLGLGSWAFDAWKSCRPITMYAQDRDNKQHLASEVRGHQFSQCPVFAHVEAPKNQIFVEHGQRSNE